MSSSWPQIYPNFLNFGLQFYQLKRAYYHDYTTYRWISFWRGTSIPLTSMVPSHNPILIRHLPTVSNSTRKMPKNTQPSCIRGIRREGEKEEETSTLPLHSEAFFVNGGVKLYLENISQTFNAWTAEWCQGFADGQPYVVLADPQQALSRRLSSARSAQFRMRHEIPRWEEWFPNAHAGYRWKRRPDCPCPGRRFHVLATKIFRLRINSIAACRFYRKKVAWSGHIVTLRADWKTAFFVHDPLSPTLV